MKDIASIAERKLVQWTVAYVAVAWAILEGVDVLSGMWAWPTGVGRVAFVVLATGLGVTVVLAWFHGERGRQRPTTPEIVLLTVIVITGAGAAAVVWGSRPGSSRSTSVADVSHAPASTLVVLPFRDLSPGGGRGYLGDGIAETLINSLAHVAALKVVARTSAFAFRDSGDVREIGRRLGAGSVVDGTVTQVAGRVRITASLVDAGSGQNLWADKFDEEVDETELFDLQDAVAREIVDALRGRLEDGRRIVREGTRNPDAQRAYYLGLHHWTARTTADMARATELFQEAIAADSLYAAAWGGLALSYNLSTPAEYAVPGIGREEALDRAEAAARRALELDPELAPALTSLGDAAIQRGNLDQGERWLRQAIQVAPGYATAHHWLADLLMRKLDGGGALAQITIAETLDPVAPAILVERAEALMVLGRHDDAVAQIDKTIALLPDAEVVRLFASFFFMRLGMWDRVAEQIRWMGEIAGDDDGARLASVIADPERRSALLREMADVGVQVDGVDSLAARWGFQGPDASPITNWIRRPEQRFLAVLELDGADAALDLLEAMISGPQARVLYAPVIPALLGPATMRTARAQEVMGLLNRPR